MRAGALIAGMVCMGWVGGVRGAERFPDWAKSAVQARDAEPNRNLVPRDYSRDEIIGLLRPQPLLADDKQAEIPWTVLVKPWRSTPGLSVAVMEVRTVRNLRNETERWSDGRVYLTVFAGGTSGAVAEVKARASVTIGATERLESLDLAAYRITKDKVAMGVRTTRPFDHAGTDTFLTLFLMEGEKLRLVWSTVLSHYSCYFVTNDNGVRERFTEGFEDPAVIVVLKSKSHGFFGLRKQQVHFSNPSEERTIVYKWDGKKYLPEGDDFDIAPSSLMFPVEEK